MNKNIIVIISLVVCYLFSVSLVVGQTLKRSVVGGAAMQGETNGIEVRATVAQPPNAGTIGNTDVTLRQGFQQPLPVPGGGGGGGVNPNLPPCTAVTPTFDLLPLNTPCGDYFEFQFTGSAPAGYSYQWAFQPDGLPAMFDGLTPGLVGFADAGVKTVRLTVYSDTCASSSSRAIDVQRPAFGSRETITQPSCGVDASGKISLLTFNGTPPYIYRWSNGATTSEIVDLLPGTYSVTVTDSGDCTFTTSYLIRNATSSMVLTANLLDEDCDKTDVGLGNGAVELVVTNGEAPYRYAWSNGTTTQNLLNVGAEVYTVTVTDKNGCTTSRGFLVSKKCDKNNIPNIFTPNGDGKNETWVIPGILDYPNNVVTVYNRWGNIVFRQNGYTNTWAGTVDNGRELPSTAYFYVIKLNDPEDTIWSGAVTILR